MKSRFSQRAGSADRRPWRAVAVGTAVLLVLASAAAGAELQLLRAKPDPYGYPRPAPSETGVPVGTSFFFQVGFREKDATDAALPDSVTAAIQPLGGPRIEMLGPGRRFAEGYSGKVIPIWKKQGAVAAYIDGPSDLAPGTTYEVSVRAESREGATLEGAKGSWRFTTGDAPATHAIRFGLDLSQPPVRWRGGFFTGFCKPSFCTSASNRIPGYELMDRVRQWSPKAWSLQRDFSLTGMQHQPRFLQGGLPNVVRERETRRIVAIEQRDDGALLRVEDFFGCEQYGIASGRPLAGDYHVGDEVLVSDGISDARAKVAAIVDDKPGEKSLLVASLETPAEGWRIDYAGPLPDREDPASPGLFPPGGCYLHKFRPTGTPHFYWGRVDREWDIAQRRFDRRLVVNFTNAPGDLAVDGRNWTYPKDYVEYHAAVRAITEHLIQRYGDACLDFVWSVFNEPDLAVAFWRSGDWDELQRFYDYTVDAVLRAFEDHGYDSDRVVVGGLEIGAIFGVHIEGPVLKRFLCHCSPRASCPGALPENAALADPRLDGKRSERVERLGRQSGGKGSPCDFISVHSYNASQVTAAKLIRAKEIALETDAEYYDDLWVNCFESCPAWAPPPDVAAADSYLGNGYFPTWCADVARRLVAKASQDTRYSYGESLITFWPWPNSNFGGHNNATRVIAIDEDGDGRKDREETVAMPILNFLGLLAKMGDACWALPEQTEGGHVVSGLASKEDNVIRVLVYTHNARDTQSRSRCEFDVTLDVSGASWPNVQVREYRFDKNHNSYYRLGRELRDRPAEAGNAKRLSAEQVDRLIADLAGGDPETQIAAVKKAASLRDVPQELVEAAVRLYEQTKNEDVRAAIRAAVKKVPTRQVGYSPEIAARVRELSRLRTTEQSSRSVEADGSLRLRLAVAANGVNYVEISPATEDGDDHGR